MTAFGTGLPEWLFACRISLDGDRSDRHEPSPAGVNRLGRYFYWKELMVNSGHRLKSQPAIVGRSVGVRPTRQCGVA